MSNKNHFILAVLCGTLLYASVPALADMNEMAMRGEEEMNKGSYDQAIAIFEKIVQTGQTYENIMSVKFDLAWCYYQRGKYDKAIPLFEDLSGVRAPTKEIKEQSASFLGDCYARLASVQTGSDQERERKKNLEKAVSLLTDFLKTYPNSINGPYALYGRAFAYYLNEDWDKARADLEFIISRYGNNPIGMSARFLLGSVYSQQALQQIKGGKQAEAQSCLKKAREIFDQISKTDVNLALANNSNYSLADTWFGAEQYDQAIQYYRNVRPKNDVLNDLKTRRDDLRTQLARAAARGGDVKAIKDELGRVDGQYASVQEAPDPMLSAYFRIADAFFRLNRYQEAITICRHLLKFTQGKQYEQAAFLIINGELALKDPVAASQYFEEFKAKLGADRPEAERTALSIGQLFFVQKNTVTALQYFAESVDTFPNGKGIEDALYMKAICEYELNQSDPLHETVENYMDRFPKGHFLPNLLYFKAISLGNSGQPDEALKTIDELLRQFPKGSDTFEQIDAAIYQKGTFLIQLKKTKEAIALFEDFLARYKNSQLRPYALFQLSLALNDNGQFDKSVAILEEIVREYHNMDIAVQSLRRIGFMYYEKKYFDAMSSALERFTVEYPDSEYTPEAFFFLGWVAKEELKDYAAAVNYLWQAFELAPENDRAPEVLFLIAQSLNEKAQSMGQPTILPDRERAVYKQDLLDSAETCEMLLKNYPAADQTLSAIPGIADTIFNLVRYRMMTADEAEKYFGLVVAKYSDNPSLQAQIMFAEGMFFMKNAEKDKALQVFKKAYELDPNVHLSSQMLLDYADACKDASALQEASEIYQRVAADFASDQDALAAATYGLADISFREGKDAEAEQAFMKVLKDFPAFEKGRQGKIKIAQIRERRKDYEAAERMYTEVATQERAPEIRIGAMLGIVRCQLILADKLEKEGKKQQALEKFTAADNSVSKIIVLFEAYPEFVSEALWHKGQIYEMQKNYDMARQQYELLVKNYKQFSWAKKAEERLKVLPAPAAGK